MKIATVISSAIENGLRIIKATTLGTNRETADSISQGCIDFKPTVNMKAIFGKTANSSEPVIVGYLNKSVVDSLEDGEGAFYSTDGETSIAIIKALNDGDIQINEGEDYAVRYSALETAYNELKAAFNDHVTAYNSHVHSGVLTGAAVTAITTSTSTQSSGDITESKVDNVRLP